MSEPLAAATNPDIDAIRAELIRTNAELQRRIWARDPVAWARERLGYELWWGQKRILEAVRDHRRVAVQSANGISKTFTAAIVCCWWLDTHLPGQAYCLTSAATMQQVETRLWREIHRAHEAGKLAGRLNLTSWIMPMPSGREETVALGVKPADNDPSAIKGIHSPAALVIFDEAQAMDAALWSAAATITTSAESRFLAEGNPDSQLCRFYEVCQPNSGWHHIALSAYDSPNFYTAFEPRTFKPEHPLPKIALDSLVNFQFIDDLIKEWGLDHPFYISQVEGKFPESSEDTLIRLDWIRRAQESHLEPSGVVELGVDVGGGVAASVVIVRHGPVATIDRCRTNPDTTLVAEDVIAAHRRYEPTLIKIDAVGIGNNVAGQLVKGQLRDGHNRPIILPVLGVNVGGSANDIEKPKKGAKLSPNEIAITNPRDSFGNLRAEGYWHLRELFRTGAIRLPKGTPDADRLAGELAGLKYRSLAGRLYIESKDDMKRRGLRSPDLADALMLAFMQMPVVKKKGRATWGSGRLAGRR
jgi:hypothetical protein